MKPLLTLLFVTLSFVGMTQQNHKQKKEEIKAQKIAFLTTELNLTEKESEKFWPVYNEYDAKMMANRKAHRSIIKKLKKFDELSGDEAYSLSEQIIQLETERAQIRKEYLPKFSKVLGKKKGAKVFYAEEKFKRQLLRKIRNANQPQRNNPPVRP